LPDLKLAVAFGDTNGQSGSNIDIFLIIDKTELVSNVAQCKMNLLLSSQTADESPQVYKSIEQIKNLLQIKMKLINIADMKNPETGKTYREENNEKIHNIPLGTLVEVGEGLRLFVVQHDRDCDGTPLYSLSFDKKWKPDMFGEQFKTFARWAIDSGYSEDCLKVVSQL